MNPAPVSWAKWITFTELIHRIKQEEDSEAIVEHLSTVYNELCDKGQKPFTAALFSSWLSKLTSDGPEVTSQVFSVLDRDGNGHIKQVEFVLGILCVFMQSEYRTSCTPALISARRQLIFMYLDINAQGVLSESDFLRVVEMESELHREKTALPPVSYGLKSCLDGAAVCMSAAADNEFRVHDSPNQASIVRNILEYTKTQGPTMHYDAYCEAFERGVLPEPVRILHWDLDLKTALGIVPKPSSISPQPLQDIRNALVTILDDGMKVASIWLKNTANLVHNKASTGLNNEASDPQISVESIIEDTPTQLRVHEAHDHSVVAVSKSEFVIPKEASDSIRDESECEETESTGLACDNKKCDIPDQSMPNELPAMLVAVTTATEDDNLEYAQRPIDCLRVESTTSAMLDFEGENIFDQPAKVTAEPDTLPFTECSADDSIPEEGEARSVPSYLGRSHIKKEHKGVNADHFINEYLLPILQQNRKNDILRSLPNRSKLSQDCAKLLSSLVETFAAELLVIQLPSNIKRCIVLGSTRGDILRITTMLHIALLSLRNSNSETKDWIPEGTCLVHSGNFLCPENSESDVEALYSFMALFSLKVKFPDRVFILRGHYEAGTNNALQKVCVNLFGTVEGVDIWNRIMDITEYTSYAIEFAPYGWIFGGSLTLGVEERLLEFNKVPKPLRTAKK
eukprot:Gregarina_sp_Poly_1__6329@NODE_336_length_9439_cov_243_466709_g284_i0_p2_GENE_NODE_336_length_9439_cov_243_466709_g284_i0NODE_336_length_9439_cov_243_466709_g284_i0_p2_ORF_typecomplete_len706_score75_52EFhand_7/PF13499_6/0_3EFhand_7/PF13499_6/3_1EFhand_8/PF13833_6/0_25EFhand_8/PF13833_6/48EFhand_6/PF13405_6/0_48EFhand_6/PF13405_6/4_6e02EFhand_5/PF13202_6/3_3EFhand_5/PF13202_6/3_8e02_NODE_336_length_9439_cov_243_466709_g284_i0672118